MGNGKSPKTVRAEPIFSQNGENSISYNSLFPQALGTTQTKCAWPPASGKTILGGSSTLNMRRHYERKFASYPDVVDVVTFRKMLGGVSDSFARRLIRENRVKHIFIKPHYWIFKSSVINYVLSDDYGNRRLKVWA